MAWDEDITFDLLKKYQAIFLASEVISDLKIITYTHTHTHTN